MINYSYTDKFVHIHQDMGNIDYFCRKIEEIMYKKKMPFDIECGVKITMEVMGGKWKSCILIELMGGAKRPSELHRHFNDASPRVIDQQLKELEAHGMINKKIFAELPPRSEYSITEQGKTLIPIIEQINKWGDNFRPQMIEILKLQEVEVIP